MTHHEAFEATDVDESAASELLDLRILIGGLCTLYGVPSCSGSGSRRCGTWPDPTHRQALR